MTILVLVLLVTATTIVLARTILRDGYGSRPVPPSRYSDLPPHRVH